MNFEPDPKGFRKVFEECNQSKKKIIQKNGCT